MTWVIDMSGQKPMIHFMLSNNFKWRIALKKIIVKIKMHSSITKMTMRWLNHSNKSLYMYPKVPPSVAIAILQVFKRVKFVALLDHKSYGTAANMLPKCVF